MHTVIRRHNVTISGPEGAPAMVFAHGFGCDQDVWRFVAPAFSADHRVELFDHIGFGEADAGAYDPARHGSLSGYATDVLELCDALDLGPVTFVGHSVSAMIGVLAAIREPERFARLVLVTPSPRHIDDDGYAGGLSRAAVDELMAALDQNIAIWSTTMAPVVMGNPDRPDLSRDLAQTFCRMHPEIGPRFARLTFLSDHRAELPRVSRPALVLQCAADALAPLSVGDHVHRAIPGSVLVRMRATGHCPHLSAPGETIAAIRSFV
jgi:sigma-B regulation protein RsbQ